jgi:hypothetical protein
MTAVYTAVMFYYIFWLKRTLQTVLSGKQANPRGYGGVMHDGTVVYGNVTRTQR